MSVGVNVQCGVTTRSIEQAARHSHHSAALRRPAGPSGEQLREKVAGYGGLIRGLAAQLNDPTLVSYRPIAWMLIPAPWHRCRVVLIGDAAHANPPMSRRERRWGRVKLVVEASCNVAKNEVEHTPGFDAAAEIRRASTLLAEAY